MSTRVLHAVTAVCLSACPGRVLIKLARALCWPEYWSRARCLGHSVHVEAEFSTLEDFEREVPSLCFALARAWQDAPDGAFIAYLHLAHGIKNFFVLAPNLTIYKQALTDFTRNTPK